MARRVEPLSPLHSTQLVHEFAGEVEQLQQLESELARRAKAPVPAIKPARNLEMESPSDAP